MAITVVNLNSSSSHEVYIGRGSKWGNPFVIGQHGNRKQVIASYEEYLLNSPNLIADLHELKNKRLGCFCAPLACHGDILKRYAEEEYNNKITSNDLKNLRGLNALRTDKGT